MAIHQLTRQVRARLGCSGALLFAVLFGEPAVAQSMQVTPGVLTAVNRTDERYQSYNIEMAEVIGARFWKPYSHLNGARPTSDSVEVGGQNELFEQRAPVDLSNQRLRVLASALGPAYLRVSGTWANSIYFQDDDAPPLPPPEGFRGVLTRAEWRGVVEFAKAVDAQLVTSFAISPGVRDVDGRWTVREAKALIDFTHSIGGEIVAAELFNEPNVPSFGAAPAHYDAAWFARDEQAFRSFAAHDAPHMLIVGPGDAQVGSMEMPGSLKARDLLTTDPAPHFDVFSYHFYGAVSRRCAPAGSTMGTAIEQALSEEWLSRTDQAFATHKLLRDQYAAGKPIWLTETAEAACGGDPWAATYADSFRYLDQSARLAKSGVVAIFHNTLAASEYGLIDQSTLQPRPDYWAALLWRRLMGNVVLDAGTAPPKLHLYAHCLRDHPGGVALLALNLSEQATIIGLNGAHGASYALTADSLQSPSVQLNGRTLALTADDHLPALRGSPLWHSQVRLAPRSIEFIAVPNARNASCH